MTDREQNPATLYELAGLMYKLYRWISITQKSLICIPSAMKELSKPA